MDNWDLKEHIMPKSQRIYFRISTVTDWVLLVFC